MTKHKTHDALSWSMQRNVLHICSMIQICETATKNTNSNSITSLPDSLNESIPHPLQSQSRFYNHYLTHLPLPILFVLLVTYLQFYCSCQCFLPQRKSKCLYTLSEVSYFYDLGGGTRTTWCPKLNSAGVEGHQTKALQNQLKQDTQHPYLCILSTEFGCQFA